MLKHKPTEQETRQRSYRMMDNKEHQSVKQQEEQKQNDLNKSWAFHANVQGQRLAKFFKMPTIQPKPNSANA